MTGKPEILFLSHRIPYPPDKGDKIRSWRLFRHLAERFSVHLACFIDNPDDFAHADFLRETCASATFVSLKPTAARIKSAAGFLTGEPLSFPYYRSRKMARAVAEIRARPLAAEIAFSSTMAQYIATPVAGRARIVDFCDADSEKWLQYAEETDGPLGWIYNREGHRLARAETEIANWADKSFAVTADEADIFNKRKGAQKPVDWWSNGVDTDYFNPALSLKPLAESADVVFTGVMDYRANVDAVLYFTEEVWPLVRKAGPHATFAVVGTRPANAIAALDGENGVTVTGRVDDTRPWLKQAKVIVAPLRIARGVQNKVLEGMAMAKPVVASLEAAEGIVAEDGGLCIGGDAESMAAAIIRLLNDPGARRSLGERARNAVLAHYNWETQLQRFDRALPDPLSTYSLSCAGRPSNMATSA